MLSEKYANIAIKILALAIVAALSFFVAATAVPETGFIKDSIDSVQDSQNTVMEFSAATLASSVAITALPDDFATPLADSLADMNIYFVLILVVLFLEKILIQYGLKLAFAIVIPIACTIGILFIFVDRPALKSIAVRLCILALSVSFVIPCSTHITNYVASDLNAYVNETIDETNAGANKINEAMTEGAEDQTIFERMSELFQTAINGVSDLMVHIQNTIRRCMNSIAILILTNCLMPLLNFFVLKWILKETFHIMIPIPPLRRRSSEPATAAATGGET